MNILVLGATGRTGRLTVEAAIARGHHISAIVRDKSKINLPGVNCFEGSPTDEALIGKVIQGMDAVVVALSINRKSDSPFAKIISPLTIISDSVKALVSIMEKNNVKRVVSISASGVGDSWKDLPFVAKIFVGMTNIKLAYKDHDRHEQMLRNSKLDWTIVRPVMLNDKETDNYRVTSGKPESSGISRKAVAKFIIDSIESGDHVKQCLTIYT
jgi:putative NADH-flavin reductase